MYSNSWLQEVSARRVVPRSLPVSYTYVYAGALATIALIAVVVLDLTGRLGSLGPPWTVITAFSTLCVGAFTIRSYNGLRHLRRSR
jgi:hypothetical protein